MGIHISIDILISLLALLVALYSVWYTKRFNRPRIQIEGFGCDLKSYDYPCIDFTLLNVSNVPITIKSIIFKSNEKLIDPVWDYEGPMYSVTGPLEIIQNYPVLDADPIMLDEPITLLPNSDVDFRYYFPELSGKLEIVVNTNRFLSVFSKEKSFVFRTNKRNQYRYLAY